MAIIGTQNNDNLIGTGWNDEIYGLAGDDIIDGGAGVDTLIGGADNDTYYYDGTDKIIETADGGYDVIHSTVSFDLRDVGNIEGVILDGSSAINGTGNDSDNYIVGNTGANILTGNGGQDMLIGAGGEDTLIGGTEDDRYYGDSATTFLSRWPMQA